MTDKNTPKDLLVAEYVEKIAPLVPLAKRAYGSRDQQTPAHEASREYTGLLVEFNNRGGNLAALAQELGVSYSGIRRRIFTADIPTVRRQRIPAGKVSTATIDSAVSRVQSARAISTGEYHRALHEVFDEGIPMNMLARRLGISNAAPLYYGVQAHAKRMNISATEVI